MPWLKPMSCAAKAAPFGNPDQLRASRSSTSKKAHTIQMYHHAAAETADISVR